jgi:photosystem II stability/assembly factor-like uncharacterized protein
MTAIGDMLFAGSYGAGLFSSSDSGATWTRLTDFPSNQYIVTIKSIDGNLYCGNVSANLYRSSDLGDSFSIVSDTYVYYAVDSFSSLIYATAYGGGIFVSSDNGLSFSAMNTGLEGLNTTRLVVSNGKIYTNEGASFYSN